MDPYLPEKAGSVIDILGAFLLQHVHGMCISRKLRIGQSIDIFAVFHYGHADSSVNLRDGRCTGWLRCYGASAKANQRQAGTQQIFAHSHPAIPLRCFVGGDSLVGERVGSATTRGRATPLWARLKPFTPVL